MPLENHSNGRKNWVPAQQKLQAGAQNVPLLRGLADKSGDRGS